MSQYYTVSFAQALEGADKYGNITYSVKFQEETDSALWRVSPKTRVEPGVKVFGHIETPLGQNSGKPYRKFVRDQEEGAQGGDTRPPVTGPQKAAYGGGFKKDNSDGMRQGMCINNAAASLVFHNFEDDVEWAQAVNNRANVLYSLGDLSGHVAASTQPTEQAPTHTDADFSSPDEPYDQPEPTALDLQAIDGMFRN